MGSLLKTQSIPRLIFLVSNLAQTLEEKRIAHAESSRRFRLKHADKVRANKKISYEKNKHKRIYLRPDKGDPKHKKMLMTKVAKYLDNRLRAIDLLGGKCKDCGLTGPQEIFDFHHRNPEEKDKGASHLFGGKWSTVEVEIQKCDLLCSNCHRIFHYKYGKPKPHKKY